MPTKRQVEEIFRKFDQNNNGVLERAEISALLRCAGIDLNHTELGELISAVDLNRDGQIQFEELLSFLINKHYVM